MKKTLIMLLALSSLSLGAGVDSKDLLCTITPGANNVATITNKAGATKTSTGAAFGGYEVSGSSFTTTGGTYLGLDSWDTASSSDIKDSFGNPSNNSLTMVFDAAITSYDTTANNALVYYGRNDNNNGYALGIVNGNWTLQWGGKNGLGTSSLTTVVALEANTSDTAQHSYMLTFDNNTITAYQDATIIAKCTGGNTVSNGGLDWTIGALIVNGRGANSHGYTTTLSNVALYNGVTTPLPEPATATLSLLALAGLAARRRRR